MKLTRKISSIFLILATIAVIAATSYYLYSKHSMGSNTFTPAALKGMEYEKARSIILRNGWQPQPGPCSESKSTCMNYPEIDSCTATGVPTYCAMDFVQGSQCLIIGTTGEAPPGEESGVPTVETATLRDVPCQKIIKR